MAEGGANTIFPTCAFDRGSDSSIADRSTARDLARSIAVILDRQPFCTVPAQSTAQIDEFGLHP